MSLYDALIQKGIEKGRAEGIEKSIEKTIFNAYNNCIDLETIWAITGEPMEKIMEVLKRNNRL